MPQFRRTAMTVIVLASATPAVSAQAQIAPTDQRLPEVKVNAPEIRESAYGSVEGYRAERTGTATKTDSPIREIPSAIQIVPKQVIDDQQATRMADVIENVSSVRPGSTFGNRGDSFIVRGFQSFLSGAARQRRLSEMARRGTSGTTPTMDLAVRGGGRLHARLRGPQAASRPGDGNRAKGVRLASTSLAPIDIFNQVYGAPARTVGRTGPAE